MAIDALVALPGSLYLTDRRAQFLSIQQSLIEKYGKKDVISVPSSALCSISQFEDFFSTSTQIFGHDYVLLFQDIEDAYPGLLEEFFSRFYGRIRLSVFCARSSFLTFINGPISVILPQLSLSVVGSPSIISMIARYLLNDVMDVSRLFSPSLGLLSYIVRESTEVTLSLARARYLWEVAQAGESETEAACARYSLSSTELTEVVNQLHSTGQLSEPLITDDIARIFNVGTQNNNMELVARQCDQVAHLSLVFLVQCIVHAVHQLSRFNLLKCPEETAALITLLSVTGGEITRGLADEAHCTSIDCLPLFDEVLWSTLSLENLSSAMEDFKKSIGDVQLPVRAQDRAAPAFVTANVVFLPLFQTELNIRRMDYSRKNSSSVGGTLFDRYKMPPPTAQGRLTPKSCVSSFRSIFQTLVNLHKTAIEVADKMNKPSSQVIGSTDEEMKQVLEPVNAELTNVRMAVMNPQTAAGTEAGVRPDPTIVLSLVSSKKMTEAELSRAFIQQAGLSLAKKDGNDDEGETITPQEAAARLTDALRFLSRLSLITKRGSSWVALKNIHA